MEISKNDQGLICLTLTTAETEKIGSLCFTQSTLTLFSEPTPHDPFKGMKKKSILFMQELKLNFGNKPIIFRDAKFQEIVWKHRVNDLASALAQWEKVGLLKRTSVSKEGRVARIHSFELLF